MERKLTANSSGNDSTACRHLRYRPDSASEFLISGRTLLGMDQSITEKLVGLKQEFGALPVRDEAGLSVLMNRFEMLAKALAPSEAEKFISQAQAIGFRPRFLFDDSLWDATWPPAVTKMRATIDSLLERAAFNESLTAAQLPSKAILDDKRVFVVHGHDKDMLNDIRAYISHVGLDPLVLVDEPNEGMTIIQKFKMHAEVPLAVVLLSPDDIGKPANSAASSEQYRARQNVILELGYFLCKPGPSRTIAIVNISGGKVVEHPSDFAGILYLRYDSADQSWKRELLREFIAAKAPVIPGRV